MEQAVVYNKNKYISSEEDKKSQHILYILLSLIIVLSILIILFLVYITRTHDFASVIKVDKTGISKLYDKDTETSIDAFWNFYDGNYKRTEAKRSGIAIHSYTAYDKNNKAIFSLTEYRSNNNPNNNTIEIRTSNISKFYKRI